MKKIEINYRQLLDQISDDFNDCGAYKWLENAIGSHLICAGVELEKVDVSEIIDQLVVQMEEDLLDDFIDQFNNSYYNKDGDMNQIYELKYIYE